VKGGLGYNEKIIDDSMENVCRICLGEEENQ